MLDSSAVLALLLDRPNESAYHRLDQARSEWIIAPFDERLAVAAALLREPSRHLGLSLGDRACLALAQDRSLPVVTADTDWAKLNIGVDIRLIR